MPSTRCCRSVDLGALSRQFGGNPVGSKMLPMTPTHAVGGMGGGGMMHRAGSVALQSIGEGRVASPHSLHRAVSGNLQSVPMPMHGQFAAGSSGQEVLTPEGQLRLQAMQQLLAQQVRCLEFVALWLSAVAFCRGCSKPRHICRLLPLSQLGQVTC